MALVQANTGFIVMHDGREEHIIEGSLIDDGHAIVRNNPQFFSKPHVLFERGPEEATTKRKRTVKVTEAAPDAAED